VINLNVEELQEKVSILEDLIRLKAFNEVSSEEEEAIMKLIPFPAVAVFIDHYSLPAEAESALVELMATWSEGKLLGLMNPMANPKEKISPKLFNLVFKALVRRMTERPSEELDKILDKREFTLESRAALDARVIQVMIGEICKRLKLPP